MTGQELTGDERLVLTALAGQEDAPFPRRRMPGEVAVALGLDQRRALAVFRGLVSRGYYEYDISPYSGRITPLGRAAGRDGGGA